MIDMIKLEISEQVMVIGLIKHLVGTFYHCKI